MISSLKQNWKVYLMEAICLGIFMASASYFGTLLEAPNSFVHQQLPNGFLRLCLMGVAMGVTALLINYSPMGKLSGAHMNPAVSITFLRLGKMKMNDAINYAAFQIIGGVVSVWLMAQFLGNAFRMTPVSYVMTVPGSSGVWVAFFTEAIIAFLMMTMVLTTSNHPTLSKYTGAIAGFFCDVLYDYHCSNFRLQHEPGTHTCI